MLKQLILGFSIVTLTLAGGCASPGPDAANPPAGAERPLVTGAIPDQDPEQLQRLYGKLTQYLSKELGVPVTYKPVTDYTAAVTAFRTGNLDLVWFGGLTGVQAQLQVPNSRAIAQRDIDAQFTSVFIAHRSANVQPFTEASQLQQLKGRRLTFGSESSTSGRLMPQYFLQQNGVNLTDFKGEVGFSSSHDATLKLVESGTYEVGALNAQVWRDRLAEGKVDQTAVQVIWETPPYFDYHWVLHPDVAQEYGSDFADRVQVALLSLDPQVPEQKEILDLFGAERFIPTKNENYAQIEAIGREVGKIQ
ncbi:putative selenate ABC transporter substrate-binding protein [Lyngbya confervoides]|uniref:Selenate ABC transporter substrate-binding protein n=1 Tax=Lyngbya confervoides BDU141951 TaxID=1574623 RepID=A0ABD4T6A1_9CYAN|nr:putative selenate ABC transporter substrate-binding protein [Lyngbya confervoides]MCM1984104.1 putative selenate ABC transporter substrate-binding protein [Lyngbya confervoides BDU141951]